MTSSQSTCKHSLSTDPLFNLEFVEIALQILTAEDMTEPKYKGVGLGTLSRSRRKIIPKKLFVDRLRCVISLRSQVTPTPNEDTSDLTELTVGNNSQFNQLVQSGDVRGATQLANAVLQTANQLNSTATRDKIAVRDNITPKHS